MTRSKQRARRSPTHDRLSSSSNLLELRRNSLTPCSRCHIPQSFISYSWADIRKASPVCYACFYQKCTVCKVTHHYKVFVITGGTACKHCTLIECIQCEKFKQVDAYNHTQQKTWQQGNTPTCKKCQWEATCACCELVLKANAYTCSQRTLAKKGIPPVCLACRDSNSTHTAPLQVTHQNTQTAATLALV